MTVTRVLSHLTAAAVAATALALPSAAAHAEATGVIRGTVLETGHVIAPSLDVSLYRTSGEFVKSTVTNSAAGAYEFRGVEPGSYVIWFENQNEAVQEWYDNQADQDHATPISLAAGQTFVADAYLTQISENIVRPTITGTPTVNSTLSAARGTWFPTVGVDFSYQWLRGGARIEGATASTYRLRDVDSGHAISVRVIATVQGAQESATSAPTAPVTGGTPSVPPVANSAKPTISGSVVAGSVLTATTGSWTPADAAVTLQWLRGDVAVGSGPTYRTTAGDIGSGLRVRAVATKPGWAPAVAESAVFGPIATPAPVLSAPVNTVKPTVTGTTRVGSTVAASTGSWSSSASHTYRWTRNGRTIPRATARTYRLTAADAGTRIAVVVTAANTAGATSVTSAVRTVAKASARVRVTAKSPAKGRLKVTTKVTSAGARTGRVTITVKVGGKTKVKRTTLRKGTRTITVTGLRKGRATVRIVYAGDASTTGARASKKVTVR